MEKTSSPCISTCSETAQNYYHDSDSDSQLPMKKRRRRASSHPHVSNKRRRDRINKRLRELRNLIPHCTKVKCSCQEHIKKKKMDKESVLDEAIQYLKCLQLQIQIMPTFAGLCVPPTPFLLPTLGSVSGMSGSALDFSQLFGLPLSGYGATLEMPMNAVPATSPPHEN